MFDFLKKSVSTKGLFSQESSVVGVEVGSASIKLVQIKKKSGRAVLETYGEISLGPYAGLEVGQTTNLPEEKIVEALNDLVREAKVSATRAAFSIPLSASLISVIEMPKVDDKQLATMIPIEARRYIPVPINEVTLDWWVIPKEDSTLMEPGSGQNPARPAKVEVLIAAIHNDTVTKLSSVAQKANLSVAFFEIELFSAIRSVIGNDLATIAVLDLSAANTKVTIVDRGVVRASHLITRGAQDMTLALSRSMSISIRAAEELKRRTGLLPQGTDVSIRETLLLTTDYIFSEVNRVLLNYERKHGKTIAKVVLTGGGFTLKGFFDEAKKNIQAEVFVGNPFAKVEAPAFLAPVLRDVGPEFTVSIGLGLRGLQEIV